MNAIAPTLARRSSRPEVLRSYKDFDEDAVLDPHYVDEIAMLEQSLAYPRGMTADGIRNTRDRIALLRKLSPYFNGVTMIRNTELWPCQCERCVPET